jgi:hypothetical protein
MSKKKLYDEDGNEVKGAKVKKPFYKRWWFIGLVVLLVIGVIGNMGGEETDTADTEEPQQEEVAAEDASTEETEQAEETEEPAEEVNTSNGGELVLGEPIELGDYTMTITDLSVTNDYDGNPMLIYTYDWTNNSEDTTSPFMTFNLVGFQNDVSTESSPFSEQVDYGSGQVDVRPGGSVEGVQGAIGLESTEEPVELELTELISFDDIAYTTTVNPADYQ